MKKISAATLILLCGLSIGVFSEEASKNAQVMDFEADVIEGERTAPTLFIQMDMQTPELDTLLFQRKNFNDFHQSELKRKPRFRQGKRR